MVNCNYIPICHHFRDMDFWSWQKNWQKNGHGLFFAGIPKAQNDLKCVSGVESLSTCHIP